MCRRRRESKSLVEFVSLVCRCIFRVESCLSHFETSENKPAISRNEMGNNESKTKQKWKSCLFCCLSWSWTACFTGKQLYRPVATQKLNFLGNQTEKSRNNRAGVQHASIVPCFQVGLLEQETYKNSKPGVNKMRLAWHIKLVMSRAYDAFARFKCIVLNAHGTKHALSAFNIF